jgi:7-carboxy-7-deazaguanine synthase
MNLSINAIYRATEGEGVLIGSPQVFVRFQGCNIGCLNCDSKDTWEFDIGNKTPLEDVLLKIDEESFNGKIKRVSITGGDPLHPKLESEVLTLIKELKKKNIWINIEAAGTRVAAEIFNLVDYISFDVKTPSTGVKTPVNNIKKMIENYEGKFQIKSVIESQVDFDTVFKLYESLSYPNIPWVLTPSYNLKEEFPKRRFLNVIDMNEKVGGLFRVIGQQHKLLHGPDKKEI